MINEDNTHYFSLREISTIGASIEAFLKNNKETVEDKEFIYLLFRQFDTMIEIALNFEEEKDFHLKLKELFDKQEFLKLMLSCNE